MKQHVALLLAALSSGFACETVSAEDSGQARIAEGNPTESVAAIWLEGTPEPNGLVVQAHFSPTAQAARMADIRIATSEPLTLLGSSEGAALSAADKGIVVRPIEGGVRVIIMSSTNTNPIGRGELFTLRFARPGDGPTTFTLLADEPILAPAGAEEGLRLGDPLTL